MFTGIVQAAVPVVALVERPQLVTLTLELPETDDYESLGGLLLERLKRIPRPGETIRIGKVTFEIAIANERRVEEVILRVNRK